MAVVLDSTGTADPLTAEYYTFEQDGSPPIYLRREVPAGVLRGLRDGHAASGVLLGSGASGGRSVWIDRYRPDGGPALAGEESGDLSVAGRYRVGPASPGWTPEDGSLLLLFEEGVEGEIAARFYGTSGAGNMDGVSPSFIVRGARVERPRRLVPDFEPGAASKGPDLQFFLDHPPAIEPDAAASTDTPAAPERKALALSRWWPFMAALGVAGGAVWFMPQLRSRPPAPGHAPAAAPAHAERPLGLSVDPAGAAWRVSWNPSATALSDVRQAQLIVREGDDQNHIDLSPADLQSATFEYKPAGHDVTFRLEVTSHANHLTAESFRVLRPAAPKPTPPAPAPVAKTLAARPVHKVAPVVPSSIRPRIHRKMSVDVRVSIDATGRVTAAVPAGKRREGVEKYLVASAIRAARQWRFEPAQRNGVAVAGSETIHFEFDK